jgi:outer membrane lipoprotein-sorting protein
MKKNLRFGLTALTLMFVFGLFAATETKAQLQNILNTMDTHNKLLKSLQADVKMGKYNSQSNIFRAAKKICMFGLIGRSPLLSL